MLSTTSLWTCWISQNIHRFISCKHSTHTIHSHSIIFFLSLFPLLSISFSLSFSVSLSLQWKVRRTLAFSIHELALILGDQLTAADLVPIFNSFLKDLDEVRIGVLKHLYDFLKVRTSLGFFDWGLASTFLWIVRHHHSEGPPKAF